MGFIGIGVASLALAGSGIEVSVSRPSSLPQSSFPAAGGDFLPTAVTNRFTIRRSDADATGLKGRAAQPDPVLENTWPPGGPTVVSWEDAATEISAFYDRHIRTRLAAGLRMTFFALRHHNRGKPYEGSFVGSVTRIDEDQQFWPPLVFVEYKVNPCYGVGLTFDAFQVEAGDALGTDGKVAVNGTLLYAFARWPNETALTPFAELGIGLYSAHFKEAANWDLANLKEFELDDGPGYCVAAGCDLAADQNWALNLYGRFTAVDVDGTFYVKNKKEDDIHFPMDQFVLGIGVKYSF